MYNLSELATSELFDILLGTGVGLGLFSLFGISISPAGQPRIRLTYVFSDENGEIRQSHDEQELHRTIRNSGCLVFKINYVGDIADIKYNLKDDVIVGSDSYSMVTFELLKIENKPGFTYIGTIVKTDLEEGFFNIKVSGMLPDDAQYQELPFVTVPEYRT